MFEKSPSVGGRLATRRFTDGFVNHGAQEFTDHERVLSHDPKAWKFRADILFHDSPATALAKALRDELLDSGRVSFAFSTHVTQVTGQGEVLTASAPPRSFHRVIITAPMPQTQVLLGSPVQSGVQFAKAVLFIGEHEGRIQRLELPEDWAEAHFELPEDELRTRAEEFLQRPLGKLSLKKWRYSRVLQGMDLTHGSFSDRVFLAGDTFDPQRRYGLAAAWLSGRMAALKALIL